MDQESSREDEAALLVIFDEKIQPNRDTSASPEKEVSGRETRPSTITSVEMTSRQTQL